MNELQLKKQIQQTAKEKKMTLAEVWQQLILERFLVRLAKSPYAHHFVLKGGVLLSKYLPIQRETKDLDFCLEKISSDKDYLKKVIDQIAQIPCDDGFSFTSSKWIEQEPGNYPNGSVRLEAHLGKERFSFFLDINFGDIYSEFQKEFPLLSHTKGPLFEKNIALRCYPLSFIFAEKLETIFSRGAINSRMKDFHDIYMILLEDSLLNRAEAKEALTKVCQHRGTILKKAPIFNEEESSLLQKQWIRYRKGTVAKNLPEQINHILDKINYWLMI